MISEDRLIGWLVIARYHFWNDSTQCIPQPVREALLDRGWVEWDSDEDGEGVSVTDRGRAVSDLAMPEWGVDPIPVEDSP